MIPQLVKASDGGGVLADTPVPPGVASTPVGDGVGVEVFMFQVATMAPVEDGAQLPTGRQSTPSRLAAPVKVLPWRVTWSQIPPAATPRERDRVAQGSVSCQASTQRETSFCESASSVSQSLSSVKSTRPARPLPLAGNTT